MTASNIRQGYIDYTREEYISEDEYATRLSRGETHRGDLLFTTEAPMGYCAICEMKRCSCGQRVITLQNYGTVGPDNALFCQIILSPLFQIQVKDHATGTTAKGIKAAVLKELFLPIPPLAEQRRIVERVDELMPLVEEYGGLEDAREALDAALPGRLRKSVLQLAVQGGLVPQDPADEPAGVLLERIRGQRRQLVAEGKMRAPKGGESIIFAGSDGRRYEKRVDARGRESEPVCIEDEVPFEIPEGWEWARLGSVFSMQAGKNIKASLLSDIQTENTPYPCFGGNGIRGFVAKPNASGDYPIIGRQGALCGNVRRASGDFYATEHAVIVHCFLNADIAWACLFLSALNLNQYATSTAQPGLAISKISEVLIPIPPLAEQHRIVDHFVMLEPLVTNQ